MRKSRNPAALSRLVIITALNADNSFQAVPLGAACIVSALNHDPSITRSATIQLEAFSLDDPEIAAVSPEQAGIIIAARLAKIAADSNIPPASFAVGFSMYIWNRCILESAAAELKKLLPGIFTFVGGPEITARKTILPSFDYCIRGEGEGISQSLISSWIAGVPYVSGERTGPENLDSLASPWLDGTLNLVTAVRDGKGALWELSRGCPYSCAYCYESRGEKKVRSVPLERLEKELAFFSQQGIERVFVLDPTYNASRERALSLLYMIKKSAPDIYFNFEIRAELLDKKLVDAFSHIPCSLQIGLQSTNEAALALVNRPVNFKKFSSGVTLLNNAGVVFGFDLMYGLPGDNLKGFMKSVDYAIQLYPNNLEIFRLAVLPGTDLFERVELLELSHDPRPPYLIRSTPSFSAKEIDAAERIAQAVNIFYTQGRAVSWFLSALNPLKIRASRFFSEFSDFLVSEKVYSTDTIEHDKAEGLQLKFLEKKYRDSGKSFLFPALQDIVRLNGAWTRALADGEETSLDLSWHPEDIFSSAALDLSQFVDCVCMEPCQLRVVPGPDGPELL
ncbi:MAG TPA: radical SAM protein [Treponema sp.]|nr:radical SAM protein [Treponema sp.]